MTKFVLGQFTPNPMLFQLCLFGVFPMLIATPTTSGKYSTKRLPPIVARRVNRFRYRDNLTFASSQNARRDRFARKSSLDDALSPNGYSEPETVRRLS